MATSICRKRATICSGVCFFRAIFQLLSYQIFSHFTWYKFAGHVTYTMPIDKLRGGFRYLTIFLATGGWVEISDVSLQFTASPAMADLRAIPITSSRTTAC